MGAALMKTSYDNEIASSMGARGKHTKQAAEFGPGMAGSRCGICTHYLGKGPDQNCTEVRGHVEADDWCKYFSKVSSK